MTNVLFFKKDEGISSSRTTINSGGFFLSSTNYTDYDKGGFTFGIGNCCMRMSNAGKVICSGIKLEKSMTYIGSCRKTNNKISPF